MGAPLFSVLLRWLAPSRSAQTPSGPRYVPAPRDGSLTLPEAYYWHYERNPYQPIFIWRGETGLVHLTYSDVIPAAERAARYVAAAAGIELDTNITYTKPVVILAASDTVVYATTLIGLWLAGIPVFPITPRFSASVVAKLLQTSDACHILVSGECSIKDLARDAVSALRSQPGGVEPDISLMPSYDDLYHPQADFVPLRRRRYDPSSLATISHSSGSTSFPKPIRWDLRCGSCYSIVDGARDYLNEIIACPAIELFHAWGMMFLSFQPMTGYIMGVFPPSTPAAAPTADSVYQCMVDCQATYALSPPSLLMHWSGELAKYAYLKQMKGIVYGGRFVSKPVGEFLMRNGVRIHTVYGTTETGIISTIFRASDDEDWDYFEINSHVNCKLLPNNDLEQSYRLVVTAGPTQPLPVANSEFDGKDAYVPGDALLPHPHKPGYWRVLGRVDDQIMLSTGEIVYPSPIEARLCQHRRIKGAVMFGRGQSRVGVILELEDSIGTAGGYDCDTETLMSVIEEANETSPAYARIHRKMIIFANNAKPFTYTLKGLPRRVLILKEYQPEIEATCRQYNTQVTSSSQSERVPLIAL